MTTEAPDRRTDHATRAALLRLRMVEYQVAGLLANPRFMIDYMDSVVARELSAAIDGVIDLLREPPDPTLAEHQERIARRLFGLGGMG